MKKSFRVFITGGDGFIGTYMQKLFAGCELFVYDNAMEPNDIRDKARLDRAMENFKPHMVLHLAALAGVRRGEDHPKDYYDTNVLGTENVFSLAKKHGVTKVIMFSSSSVFNDNDELIPLSVYGRTKLCAEKIAESYSNHIPNVYIVRPFTVYGLNGRGDQVFYKWINQIKSGIPISFYGDGNTYRTYTHVQDMVKAVERMVYEDLGFQIFNLGGAEKIQLCQVLSNFEANLAHKGIEFTVVRMPLPEVDSKGKEPDHSNWDLLHWSPQANFYEELNKILDYEFQYGK